jgi:heme/copper-type cytochrome/quinol oxidase subunit 2
MESNSKEDNLYFMSSIPSIIFCIILSFIYLPRLNVIYPPGAEFDPVLWDFFAYFMTPLMIFAPLLFIITFEILDHRRTKDTFGSHLKRLGKNILTQAIAVAILTSVFLVSLTFLLPFTSAGITLAFIGIAWSLLFYVAMTRLKRVFT